ncbi:hypothetical protein HPG69_007993 [Diceros bicornis minor]|uniref:Ricin B lectin domain-containing protein n=1 Tax=Diceros bicornis minor TaxID=77932 RepID=A0A7J7EFY6_DICBM|nr:hypothetical protein HPG69_007993 [Diceros bicornis minor]
MCFGNLYFICFQEAQGRLSIKITDDCRVWRDEVKNLFYLISPGVTKVDYGNRSMRFGLRHKLQYKPLSWYLENIYPDSQVPYHCFSLGEIRNVETRQCLQNTARKENEELGNFSCHGMGCNQVFPYTANKAIRTDDFCLEVSKLNGLITMLKCHHIKGNQHWDIFFIVNEEKELEPVLKFHVTISLWERYEMWKHVNVWITAGKDNEKLGNFSCHGMRGIKVFSIDNKEIKTHDFCLDVLKLNYLTIIFK